MYPGPLSATVAGPVAFALMKTALLLVLLAVPALGAPTPKKKVTFEFVNADVVSVLRALAEVGKFNLVTADGVQGKVTMRLKNVSWDEALKAVLAAKSLGAEDLGSIVRVAPLSQLEAEADQRARMAEAELKTAPLKTTLIRVNYANANEMAQHVRATLSPRGTVAVDARTNTLIVRDVE